MRLLLEFETKLEKKVKSTGIELKIRKKAPQI